MNKKELIGAVAEATGKTKKDVELVVDSTFDVGHDFDRAVSRCGSIGNL
ncbi:HU family DNA-binding protein [Bacillus haynesii]